MRPLLLDNNDDVDIDAARRLAPVFRAWGTSSLRTLTLKSRNFAAKAGISRIDIRSTNSVVTVLLATLLCR